MSIYTEKLLNEIDKKDIPLIPNQLERIGSIFNIVQARYTLIGSISGVGKTSYVDDSFILKPFEWLRSTKSKIHFEGLYYSMERRLKFKLAKFASWKLFEDKGIRISGETISGNNKPPRDENGNIIGNPKFYRELTKDERKLIGSYTPWMDELLDLIEIKDGAKTISEIVSDIENLRRRLGTLITTDNTTLYQEGVPKKQFSGETKNTKKGNVSIITFTYKNKVYTMKQNDKLYIPNNPNMIVYIVIDHVGKIKLDGYNTKKQSIDALDEILTEARDIYGFNPIVISQFNRSLSDITRMKYSKGNLEPMYEDFKETGNPVESADLVLSLFNPYKYQSYDDKGQYKGYNIKHGLLTPGGSQRFRSLHILKNSFGIDQITFGLRFTGESMYFSTLPHPDDLNNLAKVYEDIAIGN